MKKYANNIRHWQKGSRKEIKMLFEWIEADYNIKQTVLEISELLEKKNISISEFNTIKKLLTWIVYENTLCCNKKDSITDEDCH